MLRKNPDYVSPVQLLAKVGVVAEILDEREGEVDFAMTAAQYEKLVELLPDTKFLRIKAKKVQACVFMPSLEAAVASNVKAPRVSGMTDVEIVTKSVYMIDAPKAVNIVSYAEWSADTKRGYVTVNGERVDIGMGRAEDYYEAPEEDESEWNPERAVYFVIVPVASEEDGAEPEQTTLTSYGVLNLVKRVIALKRPVIFG